MSSHFGIQHPNEKPFIWTTDEARARRMAQAWRLELVGPLPEEEAHALGMTYSGKFADSMVDSGNHVQYVGNGA